MLDKRLVEAAADVFGVDEEEIVAGSSRDTIPEWDSVMHLRLVLQVEEAFAVRFPAGEIPKLTSLAAIQDAVQRLRG